MDNTSIFSKDIVIRGLVVAGLEIIFGYSFFGNYIFIPTKWAHQFLISGVTLGIANAFFHNKNYRNGFAISLVWCMVGIGLILHSHLWWNHVLYIVDVAGIASSVYLVYFIVRQSFIEHRYQQIIVSSIIVGLANSMIYTFMGLLTFQATLGSLFYAMYFDLRLGVIMGLLLGIGNLISDYLIAYIRSHYKVAA